MYSSFFYPMKLNFISFAILFFILFSCESSQQSDAPKVYYDVKGLVEKLTTDAEHSNAKVEKLWKYDKKSDEAVVDSLNWEKELKIFTDFDLNKSAYKLSYDSTVAENEIVYKLKASESLPVKELIISLDSVGNFKSMQGWKSSENMFFTTKTEVSLSSQNANLKSYEIKSVQRLLWFEPDSSLVRARLID